MAEEGKARFLHALRIKANQVGVVMDSAANLKSVYVDRGFDGNHGGTNPIVDADVASLGLTADQTYSAAMLLGDLDAFFSANNGANRKIVNLIRDDR